VSAELVGKAPGCHPLGLSPEAEVVGTESRRASTPSVVSPPIPRLTTGHRGTTRVDRDNAGNGTVARMKKQSFDWYARVVATNGGQL
jgi:hypothetical protein